MDDMSIIWINILLFSFGFVFLLSLFFPSANIFFHFSIMVERLKKYRKVNFDVEYYRDILSYSPSELLYIYDSYYRNNKLGNYGLVAKFQKLFYVNLLKLYLLGYIKIDFTDERNFEITRNDVLILDQEYKMIYDYIFNDIAKGEKVMLSDVESFVEENYENNSFFEEWHKLIIKKLSVSGFYSSYSDFITVQGNMIKKYYIFVIVILSFIEVYLLITMFNAGLLCLIVFPLLLVCGYYDSKSIKIKIESSKSIYERKKVKALRRFLKEFSTIEEKPIEYIKLLEDYIVYAAIFDMYDLSLKDVMDEIGLFLEVGNK